jgi:phosphatidylinositol glycan class B
VRFIYPLLPMLHIIAAPSIASFFYSKTTPSPPAPATKPITQQKPPPAPSTAIRRRPLLILLLLLNVSLSLYTTLSHQRALISCVTYIRTQYEDLALDARGVPLSSPLSNTFPDSYEFPISNFPKTTDYSDDETFVGFLMPCHSTPWRSRLFHKGLRAWALECEPPVGLEVGSVARNEYRDEADRFYDDPAGFLEREVGTRERPWPRYLVGFEGIEGVLREWYEGKMKGFQIREKWRGGNSMWHDDWRRKGDVIVWEFVEGDGKAK